TLRRLRQVHAASYDLARQPVIIARGIVPEQREMKPVLARCRAMAPARVAPRPKEHRHHIQPKTHRLRRRRHSSPKYPTNQQSRARKGAGAWPQIPPHTDLARSPRTTPDPVFDRTVCPASWNSTSHCTPLYSPASESLSASMCSTTSLSFAVISAVPSCFTPR